MSHDYDQCPARPEIENLKRWQESQNGQLDRLADSIHSLCEDEAYRRGGVHMLKWILGFAGLGGISGLVGLLINIFT